MSAEYPIVVKPLQERTAEIAHEVANSTRSQRFYAYRDETRDLPVVRISIDVPIYRIANYRTNILQLRWVKEKQKAANFFLQGEENESVQKIQHEFLWDLAQAEKESITSIITTLETQKQREPILLSSSGVIVNGNRRVAAMRELYKESPEQFPSFSHVDCMVLPTTAKEDDLKDIEVRLQMTPETRLPYGWINECLAIKDLLARGRSIDTIGSLMRLEPPRVRDKLLVLAEIDLYLKDWKGTELDYDQLSDAEEIVTQVTNKLKKKDGLQKEIARNISWVLLDQRGKDGRVYELRDVTGNLTQSVVTKLQDIYGADIPGGEGNNEDLEVSIEGGNDQPNEQGILTFLQATKDDDQAQQEIVNICRIVVEANKTKQAGGAALRSATDANSRLIEIDLTSADPSTYGSIDKQLETIAHRVQHLRTELAKYLKIGK